MSFQVTGQVQKIGTRPTNNGGLATNIQVNGEWYGCGFNGIGNVNEGDTITFVAKQNGNYKNCDARTIQVVNGNGGGGQWNNTQGTTNQTNAQGNAQAAPAGNSNAYGRGNNTSGGQWGNRGGGRAAQSGGKDDYWEKKAERDVVIQRAIQFQASRNAAIEIVGAMVKAGSASLPSAKGKHFDAILEMVDLVTARYDKATTVVMEGGSPFEDSPDVGFDTGNDHNDAPYDDEIPF